jgi:hypothetical protein
MAPELRARLESEFESDVAVLSRLLGRDLGELWFGRTAHEDGAELTGAQAGGGERLPV